MPKTTIEIKPAKHMNATRCAWRGLSYTRIMDKDATYMWTELFDASLFSLFIPNNSGMPPDTIGDLAALPASSSEACNTCRTCGCYTAT